MIMNGSAGCRQTLAAICWSFVLDALDYGTRSGSAAACWAYLQVGATGKLVVSAHAPLACLARGSTGLGAGHPGPGG
jgi:hypothetical protein